jgi:site-specific recombinase XerD
LLRVRKKWVSGLASQREKAPNETLTWEVKEVKQLLTPENELLLNNFLTYYISIGRITKVSNVAYRVRKLLSYLESENLKIEAVGYKEATSYLLTLSEEKKGDGTHYATASISNFLKKAIAFYEFLKERGRVATNPFLEIERVKVEKALPRSLLKAKEMETLLGVLAGFEDSPNLKQKKDKYRTHLIAELMYSSALRIKEVASLKVEDIDFTRGLIELEEGKGGNKRTVFLSEYVLALLKLYVEEIRPFYFTKLNNKELLFGASSERLAVRLNQELKVKTLSLKLPAISSHTLRHNFAYNMLKKGCDIRYIQDFLGHKSITTTEVYTKVDKEDLKEVLDKYHPRRLEAKDEEGEKKE